LLELNNSPQIEAAADGRPPNERVLRPRMESERVWRPSMEIERDWRLRGQRKSAVCKRG